MRETTKRRLRLDHLRTELRKVWDADVFDHEKEIKILKEIRDVLAKAEKVVDRPGSGLPSYGLRDVSPEVTRDQK